MPQLVLPVAPEIELLPDALRSNWSVTVIVSLSGSAPRAATLSQSLMPLAPGHTFMVRAIIDRMGAVATEEASEFRSLFGEGSVVECDGAAAFAACANRIALEATTDFVVFADETTHLHDRRALGVILRLAEHRRVASAGCITIVSGPGEDVKCQSVGFVPVERRMRGEVSFGFADAGLNGILPTAVYPVLANASSLFAVSTAIFRDLGGFPDGSASEQDAKLAYAIAAAKAGFVNLCTSVVCAAVNNERRKAPTTVLTPELMGSLRSSSTMLRVL